MNRKLVVRGAGGGNQRVRHLQVDQEGDGSQEQTNPESPNLSGIGDVGPGVDGHDGTAPGYMK
jgi:hypothetical protein